MPILLGYFLVRVISTSCGRKGPMKFPTTSTRTVFVVSALTLSLGRCIDHVEGFTSNPMATTRSLGQYGKRRQHNSQLAKSLAIPSSTRKTELQISTMQPVTVLSSPLFPDSAPPVKKLGKISSIVTKVSLFTRIKCNQGMIRFLVLGFLILVENSLK